MIFTFQYEYSIAYGCEAWLLDLRIPWKNAMRPGCTGGSIRPDPQAQIMPDACTYACRYWNYYLMYLIHFPLQRYTKRPKFLELYICARSSTAQIIPYWAQRVWFSVTHPVMSWVSPVCVETSSRLTVSKRTTEDTNPKTSKWIQWWPHSSTIRNLNKIFPKRT